MSVTLVHSAKVVGWNEMPFGRDTYVVSSNIVLDRALVLHRKRRFGERLGDWNPQLKFALQIVARPLQIAELLL